MTARFNRAILTILFLFFLNQAFPQLTGFRYFQLEKDNKSIKINCLYKSSNGYILVGSENGLYKFDGEKFIPVYFSNKDFIDTVTAIFQDNQQKIWVGFKSGRIAHIVNKKLLYFNPEEGTPRKKITAFLQDREKNIWFATAGEGIYYMKNGHMYLLNEEDGLSDPNVNTLALFLVHVPVANVLILVSLIEGRVQAFFVRLPVPVLPQRLVLFNRLEKRHYVIIYEYIVDIFQERKKISNYKKLYS